MVAAAWCAEDIQQFRFLSGVLWVSMPNVLLEYGVYA